VDVVDGLVALDDVDHATVDVHLLVLVLPIRDRDADAGVAAHVSLLRASGRRVDHDPAVVAVDPDR
jgi:hypothetical protein